jgi:two-component system sensor histidine kinase VicK
MKENIISSYGLPTWIIPIVFFVSILYICYQYLKFKIKEGHLEEDIVSIVNHTFRTPLTSITWYIKELEKNITQNEKSLYLQSMDNSVNRILGIVDILAGIKNVKNISGYFFQAVSIREIMETSIKKYGVMVNKKNIAFQVSISNDIPLLTVDLKKISFVIDTMIENAIFYTPKDGKILIGGISTNKKLKIYISDTGIGLSFVDKMMIFSKFYRNKRAKLMNTDGMGLRLHLSRQIIKRHRGKLYAKSRGLNEGTTFFIELPFQK